MTVLNQLTAIVVPGEFDGVSARPVHLREQALLDGVLAVAQALARQWRIFWYVPADVRRFPQVHRWRTRRHTRGEITLVQPLKRDLYEGVGEELYRSRLYVPVLLWSHAGVLLEDIAVAHRDMHPVFLAGVRPGTYMVRQMGGDVEKVPRRAPGHFLRPPSTVRAVHWWDPPRL